MESRGVFSHTRHITDPTHLENLLMINMFYLQFLYNMRQVLSNISHFCWQEWLMSWKVSNVDLVATLPYTSPHLRADQWNGCKDRQTCSKIYRITSRATLLPPRPSPPWQSNHGHPLADKRRALLVYMLLNTEYLMKGEHCRIRDGKEADAAAAPALQE